MRNRYDTEPAPDRGFQFDLDGLPEGATAVEESFPIALQDERGCEFRDDCGELPQVEGIMPNDRIVVSGLVNLSIDDDVRRCAVWPGETPDVAALLDAAFAAGRREGVEAERARVRRVLGL